MSVPYLHNDDNCSTPQTVFLYFYFPQWNLASHHEPFHLTPYSLSHSLLQLHLSPSSSVHPPTSSTPHHRRRPHTRPPPPTIPSTRLSSPRLHLPPSSSYPVSRDFKSHRILAPYSTPSHLPIHNAFGSQPTIPRTARVEPVAGLPPNRKNPRPQRQNLHGRLEAGEGGRR